MTMIVEFGVVIVLLALAMFYFAFILNEEHKLLKFLLGGVGIAFLMYGAGAEITIAQDYNSTVCGKALSCVENGTVPTQDINCVNMTFCNTPTSEAEMVHIENRFTQIYKILSMLFWIYLAYLVFFVLLFPSLLDFIHQPKKPLQTTPESQRMRRF